jgi:hypothetical protein
MPGRVMSVYAAFDKVRQLITFSNPLLMTNAAQVRGNATDSAASPSFAWDGDHNTGIYHPSLSNLGFAMAGVERMRINERGNVGIGTQNPQGLLHVQGTSSNLWVGSTGTVGIGTVGTLNPTMVLHTAGFSLVQVPTAIFEERVNSGVNSSGAGAANTWIRRALNTAVLNDAASGITFDSTSNTFTLPVGKYSIYAEAPAWGGRHRIRLFNVTTSMDGAYGTSEVASSTSTNPVQSKSTLFCIETVSASTTYRLDHLTSFIVNSSTGHFGLPIGSNGGTVQETYARVVITRIQ